MMGNWTELRSGNGRLLARIDADRRLLELVRNGEQTLIDLDQIFVADRNLLSTPTAQAGEAIPPAPVGPQEVKADG